MILVQPFGQYLHLTFSECTGQCSMPSYCIALIGQTDGGPRFFNSGRVIFRRSSSLFFCLLTCFGECHCNLTLKIFQPHKLFLHFLLINMPFITRPSIHNSSVKAVVDYWWIPLFTFYCDKVTATCVINQHHPCADCIHQLFLALGPQCVSSRICSKKLYLEVLHKGCTLKRGS